MMRALFAAFLSCLIAMPAVAQGLQALLQAEAEEVLSPGRRTVGPVLGGLVDAAPDGLESFLEAWRDKRVWRRADGMFFVADEAEDDRLDLIDVETGAPAGQGAEDEFEQSKPNGGVRREIASALVAFQLSSPDRARRVAALDAVARDMEAEQLAPLMASIDGEEDGALRARKARLANMLVASHGETTQARIEAIARLGGETDLQARAVLNRILTVEEGVAVALPEGENIARVLVPGEDMSVTDAYAQLVDAGLAQARIGRDDIVAALVENMEGDRVGGVARAELDDEYMRRRAYEALAARGVVPPFVSEIEMGRAVASHAFYTVYDEADAEVTAAAEAALAESESAVAISQGIDLGLDALSLASIFFLAAIGLAITFGVMGVINMAHGEFIMMGAYTGYVVQQIVPDYTLSILIALPLAFAVTFAAGVAMERLVIRWLYHRPLETLLATFGISIALQQIAKNVFGTQARPLTSPGWLDGAWVVNDVIAISYIRIAIFVLALVFLGLTLLILNRTRLGLEVRAVTQNPGMAASMGIDPDRINMLTFGLGSGIAGIAGVAIGLYAKVTSEMGADYIVQSFMTVVVGGVGNVWGTLAGATLIGGMQKGIEWLNPSNTLAAQTYMILFIILFIQFRPRGIVAPKGRAAGD
ncbi:urea ABC transporter permease subunit UrtB [Roseobacter sp. HKCCA0434]|uniref:urea ABC transporter permease subunit UrtB n=1 Tax=Roseobacter sp. HKCCA0434 TaxID=3079297 RepID=UPI002905C877|nr:urea ABC transporter permease subunit UrtB [Roseobacter sp. HKCCA0434]